MRGLIAITLMCAVVSACKPQVSSPGNSSTTAPKASSAPVQSAVSPNSNSQKPMDLNALVPQGYKVVVTEKGDLNGDGIADAIVIADEIGEANAFTELKRVVLVFLQKDGKYTLAGKSSKAARCATCGGVSGGDPLHELKILPDNRFSILLAGGSREKWSDRYVFRYDPTRTNWMLDSVESSAADPDSGQDKTVKLGPDKIGAIPFDQFDPDAIPRAEVQ